MTPVGASADFAYLGLDFTLDEEVDDYPNAPMGIACVILTLCPVLALLPAGVDALAGWTLSRMAEKLGKRQLAPYKPSSNEPQC